MKLNKKAFCLTTGIFLSIGNFLVINYLLIMGTPGETIAILGHFYFGFSFSFVGSLLGLIWGFVYGFILGWLFALLYNLFAKTS